MIVNDQTPLLEEITGGILRQDFPYILLYK